MYNFLVIVAGLIAGGANYLIYSALKTWIDAKINAPKLVVQKHAAFLGMPADELRHVSSVMEKYSWLILLANCSMFGLLAFMEYGV